jgi:para-nitrobenzyl esterase
MTAAAPRASTPAGRLLGRWDGGVAVFAGIPFGAPPVGPLRWRPPRRVAGWDGERPAVDFGPAPLQPQPPRDSVMYRTNFADRRPLVMSEDCLYLNVWTAEPSPSARLPVVVWVHGGGNRYGYGSQDIHDGRSLAARGLVVVTLNYRLGALGFLAHPELAAEDGAAGNYGLLDIVAALEWVQDSIAAFGGDPAKVTVAGNSAGAAHLCHLMAVPRCRPLFRAAIGQSASGIYRAEGPLPEPAAAQDLGVRYAERFGGADLARLRGISGVELVVAGHFGPVVDGRLLTRDTRQAFDAGEQHPVPLLVGSNLDEGTVYTRRDATPAGPEALYPTADPASARRYTGETRFVYPVWRWAKTHCATAATWMYRFTRTPPVPDGVAPPPDGRPGYGAYHTAELPYALDNLRQLPWRWQDADRELAAAMGDAWARFVRHGDPNGGTLPEWGRFTGDDDAPVMVFGEEVRPGVMDRLAAMRLLDARR